MAKTKSKQGGKRKGSGRKKRVTAVKKTVLIETSSVAILTQAGDGYLGKGIDLAAEFLQTTKKEVSNGKEK
jgi:hypothetical protein